MKVLVTGCEGFVGHAACAAFHAAGHAVLGIDVRPDQARPWTTVRVGLAAPSFDAVLDESGATVVVHAAGSASVAASFDDPAADFDASVTLMRLVLESARRTGRRPLVIYPSSAAVYGNPESVPVAESAPTRPVSPYGFHKLMCEQLASSYFLAAGVPSIGLRVFSLLGPRQRRLLVYELMRQALDGAPDLVLQGTGEESRDYLDVDDLGALMVQVAAAHPGGEASVLNAASGVEVSTRALAGLVAQAAGRSLQARCLGLARPGDPVRWSADTRALKRLTPGLEPRPLAASLLRCAAAWGSP